MAASCFSRKPYQVMRTDSESTVATLKRNLTVEGEELHMVEKCQRNLSKWCLYVLGICLSALWWNFQGSCSVICWSIVGSLQGSCRLCSIANIVESPFIETFNKQSSSCDGKPSPGLQRKGSQQNQPPGDGKRQAQIACTLRHASAGPTARSGPGLDGIC